MPGVEFTFSQSSLQDYSDCPRRFQLRYLEALEYPAVESEPSSLYERQQLEGQHFHRMAQQFVLGIPEEKIAGGARSRALQHWWQSFLTFFTSEVGKNQGLLPEVSLATPLGDSRLIAKFDLLALCVGGQLRIYDWKTYRKRPRNEWLAARWQTRVYRALLVQAGAQFNQGRPVLPESCEMVYWFANFPDDPARFPYSTSQFKRDWEALEILTAEISLAAKSLSNPEVAFPLTDDLQKCAYCQYRSYCDRGVQAGELEFGETEREFEDDFNLDFEQIAEIEF